MRIPLGKYVEGHVSHVHAQCMGCPTLQVPNQTLHCVAWYLPEGVCNCIHSRWSWPLLQHDEETRRLSDKLKEASEQYRALEETVSVQMVLCSDFPRSDTGYICMYVCMSVCLYVRLSVCSYIRTYTSQHNCITLVPDHFTGCPGTSL